ncbi:translation initiation factor IF-3 [candidate division WWE3 bacterium]|nr:translation initiation factor IF-3 [candidate division WWE3 bacterium]
MKKNNGLYYPTNQNIRDNELRVIDAEGQNLGILSREVALTKAAEAGLDLVLISAHAKPPVARIVDYSKFKYEKEKAAAQSRKGRSSEVKELRFRPNIDDHDLEVRIKRTLEFIKDGNKVKFTIRFSGRMITRKQLGYEKMGRIIKALEGIAEVEKQPAFEGDMLITIVKPVK